MGPRRLWYWVGAVVGIVGVVAAVALIASAVVGFARQIDDFQRVPVGEEGRVTLATAGYTVYYEGPHADDTSYGVRAIDVEIAPVGGRPLPLSDYDSDVTYASGDHEGRALYSFEVDEPGSYVVRSTSRSADAGELAIGRGLGRRLVGPIVGGVFLGLWGTGGGIGIVLLTALRRRDARRHTAR